MGGGLARWVGGSRVGGLAGWGEVTFQSVDRYTHERYWFLSRQRHLDGLLRATINEVDLLPPSTKSDTHSNKTFLSNRGHAPSPGWNPKI